MFSCRLSPPLVAILLLVAGCGADGSSDVALRVDTVEPACGDRSAATPIVVRGSLPVRPEVSINDTSQGRLDTTYQASIRPVSTSADVALAEVRWGDASSLQAVVPAGMAPGLYDITVVSPFGQSVTKSSAFEVHDGACPAAAVLALTATATPSSVGVGGTVTVTAEIRNDGGSRATALSLSPSSVPPNFGLSDAAPGAQELAAGESRVFTWTYTATAVGAGAFSIAATAVDGNTGSRITAGPASTGTVTVTEAAQPALAIAFSNPPPAQVSVGQSFTTTVSVRNPGTSAISSISLAASTTGGISGGLGPAPFDLAPGGARSVDLTFTAATIGQATLSVTASAAGATPATTSAARIQVQAPSALAVAFTTRPPTLVSVGQTFTAVASVRNTGTAALTGVAATASTTGGIAFASANPTSFTLAAGASRSVTLTFSATTAGAATLIASASAPTTTSASTGAAQVTVVAPAVTASFTTAPPAQVKLGHTFTATVSVRNAGANALSGVAVTASTTGGIAFVSSNPSSFSLAVGATRSVTLTFATRAVGPATATATASAPGATSGTTSAAATTVVP